MIRLKHKFQTYSIHDEFKKWAFDGIQAEVWLHAGLFQRVMQDLAYIEQLRVDQKEIGGLLLGTHDSGTIKLTMVETYCSRCSSCWPPSRAACRKAPAAENPRCLAITGWFPAV